MSGPAAGGPGSPGGPGAGDDLAPEELVLDREARVLEITWSDGRVSRYGFDVLRLICPCAVCRERRETAGPGESLRVLGAREPRAGGVDIHHVTPVGRYGINLRFSDGHATGIYTFDFLREADR